MSAYVCPSTAGPGVCMNHAQHTAPFGCVHYASWCPDRHDRTEGVQS